MLLWYQDPYLLIYLWLFIEPNSVHICIYKRTWFHFTFLSLPIPFIYFTNEYSKALWNSLLLPPLLFLLSVLLKLPADPLKAVAKPIQVWWCSLWFYENTKFCLQSVKPEDTCQSIASKHDITKDNLVSWTSEFSTQLDCNNIKQGDVICVKVRHLRLLWWRCKT